MKSYLIDTSCSFRLGVIPNKYIDDIRYIQIPIWERISYDSPISVKRLGVAEGGSNILLIPHKLFAQLYR